MMVFNTPQPVTEVRLLRAQGSRTTHVPGHDRPDGTSRTGPGRSASPRGTRLIHGIDVLEYSPRRSRSTWTPCPDQRPGQVLQPDVPTPDPRRGILDDRDRHRRGCGPVIVAKVAAAQADGVDPASGINIDQDVPLPVDAEAGNALAARHRRPPRSACRVPVFTDGRTKTLPVNPVVIGTPAAGFEIASVTVDPPVVAVAGDADELASLERRRHGTDPDLGRVRGRWLRPSSWRCRTACRSARKRSR